MMASKKITGTGTGHIIVRELKKRIPLLPFHKQWIISSFDPDIAISALSCPRAAAKSYLCGHLAAQTLNPSSVLFEPNMEHLIVSGSREQSRILMNFLREGIEMFGDLKDYQICDSSQRAWALHKPSGARVRVLSSSAKRAFGLVNFRLIIGDEPASWQSREGALMYDALKTSLGKKAGQRILLVGTKSPAEADSWWPKLLEDGSGPGTSITVLSADSDLPWDAMRTIASVNPMMKHNPDLRKTIIRERNQARKNSHLRPTFEAYRLNRHKVTDTTMLIDLEDWKRVEARPVPPRAGNPVIGLDLGSNRSWSAAWIVWRNGRSECYALAPGIPDLATRERQDGLPRHFYEKLYEDGVLILEHGKRISRPGTLLDYLTEEQGIVPDCAYSDRFLLPELEDVVAGRFPIVARQTRWSEAIADITAFRKLAFDGPLSIDEKSRGLARLSLSKAVLRSDESGSAFIKKRNASMSRDDVAQAAALACGALSRAMVREQAQEQHQSSAIRYRVCGRRVEAGVVA